MSKMSGRLSVFDVRQHPFQSVITCHVVGATLTGLLLAATGWVWVNRNNVVVEINSDGQSINYHEAAAMLANAPQWRQTYAQAFDEASQLEQRVEAIDRWLPKSLDWEDTTDAIRKIALSHHVDVVAIGDPVEHVGTRVGVAATTCQLEGSYGDLCRLVVALGDSDLAVACSEMSLERLSPEEQVGLNERRKSNERQKPDGQFLANRRSRKPQTTCSLTLSLRLPYAADGSVAGRLLPKESSDAS